MVPSRLWFGLLGNRSKLQNTRMLTCLGLKFAGQVCMLALRKVLHMTSIQSLLDVCLSHARFVQSLLDVCILGVSFNEVFIPRLLGVSKRPATAENYLASTSFLFDVGHQ